MRRIVFAAFVLVSLVSLGACTDVTAPTPARDLAPRAPHLSPRTMGTMTLDTLTLRALPGVVRHGR